MGEIQYLQIFKESFTLVILLFCSVLSVAFTFERLIFFWKSKVDGDRLLAGVSKLLESGKAEEAQAACQKNMAPVSQVVAYGLLHRKRSRLELEELLASKRLEERMRMEKFLVVLGTMGNTAPFIGLFGTVVGIIKAFRDLALAGAGGPAVVAKGIAEALVATAGGLAVAIPAVIVYNYFMRKVKDRSVEMEVVSARLLVLLGAK
ncbi:MAG TPA: MotA/TolQ/ExbB proton channel family protein [Elusimicrobia bacterium]|nr:MotA/TolQ/ExbB proton channel family protein [Elusimicrobiota bacterium]